MVSGMASSLFDPPPPPETPPPNDPGEERPRRRRPAGRGSLALLLTLAALLGGGVSAGILAATGATGGGGSNSTTTIAEEPAPAAAVTPGSSSSSGRGLNASALYASTAAGVVDITARGVASDAAGGGGSPFGGPGSSQTATGTGFVVDGKGHIVTAAHVVDGASSITVTFQDGTTRTAKVLGEDNATDVAVLGVDPSGLTLHPLTLGSSASLGVGDAVAAIGDPFGYARSISTGIVSGLDRTIQAPNGFTVAHAIQTDAALNPGNSGGPVLDANGKVVGIADQIATGGSTTAANTGVGFAVPIDLVKSELSRLEAGQRVTHAYLGVSTSTAGQTTSAGALVGQVASGGPADHAGLRAGDVVTALGSTKVTGSNDLVAAIAAHKPGDKVTLTVRRGSQTLKMDVTLGTQPTQASSTTP
jgi:S1-C subfamily serine protease